MKRFIPIAAGIFFFITGYTQINPFTTSLNDLHNALNKAGQFDIKKQERIDILKRGILKTDANDFRGLFNLYESLYDEYKLYQYDSSFIYARKMHVVSFQLHNPVLINCTRIKMGFSLLSAGLFKEAIDSVSLVNLNALPNTCKAEYYVFMTRYYYDLGMYSNDSIYSPQYNAKSNRYLDSSLALWSQDSFEYQYNAGIKNLVEGDTAGARAKLFQVLGRKDISPHEIALTATAISNLEDKNKHYGNAIVMLIKAVCADIQSSTKETFASYALSTQLYKKNDIENASLCINKAIADAEFYGARQRKIQLSAILPVIEAQKYAMIKNQQRRLLWYAVLVSFLLLLVAGLSAVIFKQVKKLKATQETILDAHQKTQEINNRLTETNRMLGEANKTLGEVNEKLNDANKIKEEYIGYFFNINAAFFDKIERFKKLIDKKITDRKIDEIKSLVNNIDLKKEKDELLQHFDKAFLKLFPNFVAEFNELFRNEDKVILKGDELLNTDQRIFALYRMGIHEPEKIAHILQYSVNTINTYKARVKNKSVVANGEFERRIMKIRTVN